jgi:dTMP kinase
MRILMKRKGLLITFEGGDGAGKTTLIEKVYHCLDKNGRDVCKTRAPGGTEIGKEIRSLLLHQRDARLAKRCELLLFLADRAQHVEELILPALKKGRIVLCDRFNDSTIAYQGGARGLNADLVGSLCHFASSALEPDLTLYLDLDPKIGFERAKRAGLIKDRIESETLKFHQNIRKAFKQIAKKKPKRFIVIDASLSPQEVYALAKESIDALLKSYRK